MVEYRENDQEHEDVEGEAAPRRRSTYRAMPTTDEVTPPAPLPAPSDADGDGAPDAADEQSEGDVIVPADASSTEPSGDDAEASQEPQQPARPALAVLFQAPPPVPRSAGGGRPAPQREREPEPEDEQDEEEQGGSARRRRRSRRRGAQEEQGDGAAEVVAKAKPQREPITEPQKVKGSTRLEAKRQRRRDGRDAGRRRTVVTEAEFLARREAVDRVMLVRTNDDRVEIGVLEDGVLAEHYVAKHQNVSLIGNVYLGRVQNVLPSMEAAFVDIGRGRNAVLYSGEVDWEAASERLGEKGSQARKIEVALKSGDQVLVQVTKDPIGHKGARLTSAISLPGRYLVYVPNGSMSGISRKLPDTERARLKKILKDALPDSAGVIVRTAAEGATEEQLTIDVQRLANQWAEIEHLVETAQAPTMLHGEPDLLVKIVRDVFNEDFSKLIVEGEQPRATIERYLQQVAPDLLDRLESWEGEADVFSAHRVVEQIEKALDRKVWLPSGGSLVIDRTEAMTVIDVNTGKFVGSGGNLEETVTKNNLEAAEEIVRQLRLRDLGGIIVVDFIDMVLESNRDLVLRRLVECLSRDRTKHQVAEVTSLGLVQMTRKRLGIGLAESIGDAPAPDARGESRRRRGGGQQQTPPPPKPASTHTITDGAKTALAQIAASTLAGRPIDQAIADAEQDAQQDGAAAPEPQ
ncbi:Rne/Rng family ribonuclease, partial [Amnibacterium endophyticum]